MMAAIEIYNKPMFKYRDECTVILLLNAWELILKSLLSKNKKSIYYKKRRNQPYKTISWQAALDRGNPYFPNTIPYLPVRRNLELLGTYRNNAMHFYNEKDFGVALYALAQTSILNFRDLLMDSFDVNFGEQMSWQLLPIGTRPPIDAISYISGKSGAPISSAVRQFLSELKNAVKDVEADGKDTDRLLSVFDINLVSIKKIGNADIVVAIENNAKQGGPLTIVRTQDPNTSHPLRQKEILEKIVELHGKRFTSHTFQAIMWKYGIKEKPQYCWMSSRGALTFYSNEILHFIRKKTWAEVSEACKDYQEFLNSKRNTQSSRI